MSAPIVSIDSSEIRQGRLEELKASMKELVAFVEANERRPIAYNVYFDEENSRMTVAQIHPDSRSMEQHMEVAGPEFPKLADLVTLSRIDIYGSPSEKIVEQMRRKAELLGGADLAVHRLHVGFARFGPS